MMYDSYEEVYYVLDKMRPRLESSLESKGFIVLNWADGGWVHFFTQKPVAVPDDLRALKLFSWAGDAQAVEDWRWPASNPVPHPPPETSPPPQTGPVKRSGAPPRARGASRFSTY